LRTTYRHFLAYHLQRIFIRKNVLVLESLLMKDPLLPQVLNSPKQGYIIFKYQKNYFVAMLNRLETV
jgi:hypothetical protein